MPINSWPNKAPRDSLVSQNKVRTPIRPHNTRRLQESSSTATAVELIQARQRLALSRPTQPGMKMPADSQSQFPESPPSTR